MFGDLACDLAYNYDSVSRVLQISLRLPNSIVQVAKAVFCVVSTSENTINFILLSNVSCQHGIRARRSITQSKICRSCVIKLQIFNIDGRANADVRGKV